jgi:hypothetical protein
LVVDNVLGLFLLAVFAVCVVACAAGVTWAVVKISPTKTNQSQNET